MNFTFTLYESTPDIKNYGKLLIGDILVLFLGANVKNKSFTDYFPIVFHSRVLPVSLFKYLREIKCIIILSLLLLHFIQDFRLNFTRICS
jgi:hypothetical protein